MESKGKQCYRCKNLDRYYTKGIKEFNPTKFGWCCKKRENVNIHDGCEQYVLKPKRNRNRLLIRYCLNNLLTEITEIRKVIEAESDDSGKNEEV